MTTIRAAVIQCHANMPKDEAIDKHIELIGKAAAEGAQVTWMWTGAAAGTGAGALRSCCRGCVRRPCRR